MIRIKLLRYSFGITFSLIIALISGDDTIAQNKFYISPNGNDLHAGTLSSPLANWNYITTLYKDGRLTPGDTVFIRGGTYRSPHGSNENNHVLWLGIKGNLQKKIVIMAYGNEQPLLNLDNIQTSHKNPTALKVEDCDFLHVKGLRITGLKQVSSGTGLSRGMDVSGSKNNIFEHIEIDHIGGYGLILGDSTVRSLFLNIDVHHIYDSLTINNRWNNANGIQCTGGNTATNDTFRYCRTWRCSDDGFDFFKSSGTFVLDGCWSFWNGYKPQGFSPAGDGSGFKLGPQSDVDSSGRHHNTVLRTIINCVAFENRQAGFNQNSGDMRYGMYNNTSYRNGSGEGYGFLWDFVHPAPKQDFKNNISYGELSRRGKETEGSHNSWNVGYDVSRLDFLSLSPTGTDSRRNADGSLPVLPFLRLRKESSLRNGGIAMPLYPSRINHLGAFKYIPLKNSRSIKKQPR